MRGAICGAPGDPSVALFRPGRQSAGAGARVRDCLRKRRALAVILAQVAATELLSAYMRALQLLISVLQASTLCFHTPSTFPQSVTCMMPTIRCIVPCQHVRDAQQSQSQSPCATRGRSVRLAQRAPRMQG